MLNASNTYFLIYPHEYYTDKIKGFLELPEGWNHGEGTPPIAENVEKALEIANYAYRNFLSIDSAPGLEGEVQLVFYHSESKENQYLECTLEKEGSFNITLYKKRGNKWDIINDHNVNSLDTIQVEIDNFVKEIFLCRNISEYYPKDIILKTWEDLAAWHLKTLEVEYQLSENHAYQTREIQYAGT